MDWMIYSSSSKVPFRPLFRASFFLVFELPLIAEVRMALGYNMATHFDFLDVAVGATVYLVKVVPATVEAASVITSTFWRLVRSWSGLK